MALRMYCQIEKKVASPKRASKHILLGPLEFGKQFVVSLGWRVGVVAFEDVDALYQD